MKITTCKSSGFEITTKNAKRVIRDNMGLHFNCPCCGTTRFIKEKNEIKKKAAYVKKVIRHEPGLL